MVIFVIREGLSPWSTLTRNLSSKVRGKRYVESRKKKEEEKRKKLKMNTDGKESDKTNEMEKASKKEVSSITVLSECELFISLFHGFIRF